MRYWTATYTAVDWISVLLPAVKWLSKYKWHKWLTVMHLPAVPFVPVWLILSPWQDPEYLQITRQWNHCMHMGAPEQNQAAYRQAMLMSHRTSGV